MEETCDSPAGIRSPAAVQRVRLINDTLLTRPFVRLDDDRFPPGWEMRPHVHGFVQILYVIAGRGVHRVDGEHRFGAGDIVVVDAGTPHSWKAGSRGWLELIDIGIELDGVQDKTRFHPLLRRARSMPGGILHEALPLMPHVQAIRTAIREGAPFTDIRVQGLLWQLLADIGRSASLPQRGHRGSQGTDELVDALESAIATHHARRLTLDDLAAVVHVSPKYLCRIVRRERSTTPMRLLTSFRLKRAADLLVGSLERGIDIQEVGKAVGLPSRHHFTRLFHAAYGRSPSAFRSDLLKH